MCWRPHSAVPGSWEQTGTQLSAPWTLQSDVLSRRLRILSTSLIHTAEAMADLFCQLSWSMQSWRTGNMGTAARTRLPKWWCLRFWEWRKKEQVWTSLVTFLQQYWMEVRQASSRADILFSVTTVCLSLGSLCIFCGRQSHLPVLCVWLLLSLSY